MAQDLVFKVLEGLASVASQQIQQEFSLVSGIPQKIETLRGKFQAIQAVLVDAEKRQITEESVRLWLHNLKEASYEMDAVLDEWNTAITLRSNLTLSGKVLFHTHSCFHSNEVHRSGLRHRIACKIEELNDKLTNLSIEKDNYTFSTQNVNGRWERPKSISSIDESELFGREVEKSNLVSKLVSESSQLGRAYDIIPIVGAGGIGKTTLAQLVYNNKKVKAHFDVKIWVCVSHPFDVTTVARAIAEALKATNARQLVEPEALTQCIKELIKKKKFLLVLDDVWTKEYGKWKQLENSLMNDVVGNKILVTTRNPEVAAMMGVENEAMIDLKYLSDEICWSIFHHRAFFNKVKCKELEGIGWKIAQKSKGLPLVAKTLGSLMRFKEYTNEAWMEVLESALWQLGEQVTNEVFIPLLLSYYDLSPLEKRCFLYCSYFPKDYMINIDELIELWMSQGFLSSNHEREGVDCLKNLVARSLFQDFEKDDNGNIIQCKMHDIIHDFVMFLTNKECINFTLTNLEEMRLVDEKAFHCMLLVNTEVTQIPPSTYNKKNLRTLSVKALGLRPPEISWKVLLNLTCLRTLSLHNCDLRELPKSIDKLIHLRYLSLYHRQSMFSSVERRQRRYVKLPKTFFNLVNLQTLELRDGVVATCFPKRVEKLVNLRHLRLGSPPIWLPKGLLKLTFLETLDSIRTRSSSKRYMSLEDFGKLNHLKGRLHLDIGEVIEVEEAERAQLKNKERLVHLVLEVGCPEVIESESDHVLLLEGLQPHPNLKHLEIWSYHGTRINPNWMTSLVNLKILKLHWGPNCEVLGGAFGKMPSLEYFTIYRMEKVKKVGVQFLGKENNKKRRGTMEDCVLFPKLHQLEFEHLIIWEEWKFDNSCLTIMPSLVSLSIKGCYELKAPLPSFLRKAPLQNLTIDGCPYLEQNHEEGMRTEDFIKILTNPTSESSSCDDIADRNLTNPTSELSRCDDTAEVLERWKQQLNEISTIDDDDLEQENTALEGSSNL